MIRLGVLGCANIAYTRFLPASKAVDGLKVVAIAEERTKSKLDWFCAEFDLEREESFHELINRDDIDAVYIPQPPAFHYQYAKMALENGKHVLLEKPSTTCFVHSKELVEIAKANGLALHENYMFQYHKQISEIRKMIHDGAIGEVRLFRGSFGFPLREANDFRYVKDLGGGALLDAGGYPIRLATLLLGETVKVDAAGMNYLPGYEVDMYGSISMSNADGVVFQAAYGMDNSYQCRLEIWGNKGSITANRIYTAPDGFEPVLVLETKDGREEIKVAADSHFKNSVEKFLEEINDVRERYSMFTAIEKQAYMVDEVVRHAKGMSK